MKTRSLRLRLKVGESQEESHSGVLVTSLNPLIIRGSIRVESDLPGNVQWERGNLKTNFESSKQT
jgi:hypothetical protein